MTTINKLASVDSIDDGDLFPMFSTANMDARKASASLVKDYIAGTIKSETKAEVFAELSESEGSTLVGWAQAATGSVPRTVDAKLREFVSVKDFGAVGNGVADDTVEIQAAIASLVSGGSLHFPLGHYKISSALNVTKSISFIGESREGSRITWSDPTMTGFVVACDKEVSFKQLSFWGASSATAGSCISLNGATSHNLFSTFDNCTFAQGFIHISTSTAADWVINNCFFSNYRAYGVYVENSFMPDAGDSFIGSSTLSSDIPGSISVLQRSSGGLKMLGNKLLGGAYGYRMLLAESGATTIDLVLTGNSIENQTIASVSLERPLGALNFGNIAIVGNQISNCPISITTDSNPGWLSRITISGNQITLPAVNGVGISLGAPSSFLIDGNEIYGQTGTTVGISIGAAATNGLIGTNGYHNLTTKISNAAPLSVFQTMQAAQSGTQTVTCSTTYGPVYFGSASITFPTPYDSPPIVNCSPGAVAGGIAAWPFAITKVGFMLAVVSVTNGGTGLAAWDAQGII